MDKAESYFERHAGLLRTAVDAIEARGFWAAFAEAPSGRLYGETAHDDGLAAYQVRLGRRFELDQPGIRGWIGAERSPYGVPLGCLYPDIDLDRLFAAIAAARPAWVAAGPDRRAGVVLEILHALNRRSFEIAYATMYCSGQPFLMAFQAGGPHAQDRGLEAVAYAWREMARIPPAVLWEKPQGKGAPLRLRKTYEIRPAGVGVVIGCATFAAWNGYPGLFASLVTGNPVVVKPHPAGILPLAITVEIAREVLREAGFDANLVTLVADTAEAPRTVELVSRPEVRLVDFTGGSDFGGWLETSLPQARIHTEKAGVNAVLLHSTADAAGMLRNLAAALCLYSGQMCSTPQNIFLPAGGIATPDGVMTPDAVIAGLDDAIAALTADPARAVELLGAIQSDATLARLDEVGRDQRTVIASRALIHPRHGDARIRTPALRRLAPDDPLLERELFGPIASVIVVPEGPEGGGPESMVALAARLTRRAGAITWLAHAIDPAIVDQVAEAAAEVGACVSFNFTGALLVNQSAAFSDYHVSGANPAGNASLTDTAFVAGRFHIAETRRPD